MKKDKTRAYCARCRHQQLFIKAEINHVLHLVISICTGGLWLISWLAIAIGKVMRPWRCEHCGWHKPEFSHVEPRPFHPDVATIPQRRRRKSPPSTSLLSAKPSHLHL